MLESCSFSQTFYNISALYGNNKISFIVDNGIQETYNLADGFYDSDQLMTLILQALNNNHNYFTYTVANFKVTITIQSGHTLKLVRFGDTNADKIYDMLGFSSSNRAFNFNNPTNIVSNNPINF